MTRKISRHALMLWAAGLLLSAVDRIEAVQVQPAGSNHVAIEAEFPDQILNPDAANDIQNSSPTGSPENPAQVWAVVSASGASNGQALKAPASPHRQQSNPAAPESVAVYRFQFNQAGTYKAYFRASNNGTAGNGSSDSFWGPIAFGVANPGVNISTGSTGAFTWITNYSEEFTVTAGQLGTPLDFRIAVRENDCRIDGIVLSLQTNLTSSELDGILSAAVVPTPTPTGTPTPVPSPTNTPVPSPSATPCGFQTRTVTTLSQFNTAVRNACPGDTIVLAASGNWNNVTLNFNGRLTPNGIGGTPSAPITLTTETPGQVTIGGQSVLNIAGEWLVVDGLRFANGFSTGGAVIQFRRDSTDFASNCRLTNTSIESYNPTSVTTGYPWVSVYGYNNRVDHCWFDNMNHIGVTLVVWPEPGGGPNNTRIDNNLFSNRPLIDPNGNGYETIRIGTSDVSFQDSNAIVESNVFYKCDGEIETISNKSVGNVYRNNTFIECRGQLTLRHGASCIVDGNYFFQTGDSQHGGVRIVGPDHVVVNNYFENVGGNNFRAGVAIMNGVPNSPLNRYLRAERCLIAFNTFVNCREAFSIGNTSGEGDTTLAPLNCIIANNVVLSSSSSQRVFNIVTAPVGQVYEGNIVFGGTMGITPAPAGVTVQNPLLATGLDGLQRPQTGSPLIDGALGSYPSVSIDIDGQERNVGPKDVGADEVSVSPVARRPLKPEDVGPNWRRPSAGLTDQWQVSLNSRR